PGADAADALLPQPNLRAHERVLAVHVLRNVRLDFPADPVLPDRAGLLAAAGGAADPALDGDADLHRSDRRCVVGPDRRPAADGRGAGAAGDRARVDRDGLVADDAVLRRGRAVLPLRDWDGAVLRAGRKRRAQRGA